MKIHLTVADEVNLVKSVSPHGIEINERAFTASLLISPTDFVSPWTPQYFHDLTDQDFAPIIDYRPEVVILGTGARLRFPAPTVTAPLITHGIGFEVMDTRAACRTFNILASEGRKVVAAVLQIEQSESGG